MSTEQHKGEIYLNCDRCGYMAGVVVQVRGFPTVDDREEWCLSCIQGNFHE